MILEAELQRKHAEDSLEEAEALTRASEEARRQLDLQVSGMIVSQWSTFELAFCVHHRDSPILISDIYVGRVIVVF